MFYDEVKESSDYLLSKVNIHPTLGIILGSGLGDVVKMLEDPIFISFEEIPNFPRSNLQGHDDMLVFGRVGNLNLVLMQGRFHYYEGFTMKQVTFPVYVMRLIGVKNLIITNATGAINESFTPGDLMLITDYINMIGQNSLIGANDERFGVRFPDMTECYSTSLMEKARRCANNLNIDLKEGVYGFFSGPCFESKAEIRAYKALGADTVGMSTVPETIAANYLGMKVLGISCITNMATGISKTKHSHEAVLKVANESSAKLCALLKEIIINF